MLPFLLLIVLLFHPGDNPMNSSDRQRDGLRGPVKSYSEESISTYSTENPVTVQTFEKVMYSADGRVLERRRIWQEKTEWVTTYSYDSQNRLISESTGREGQPATIQPYNYDEKGRRVKTVQFQPIAHGPDVAVAGMPWENSGLFFSPYDGGTLTTVYNESGQAMEGEFRNLQGQLVMKFLRKFDARGNVTAEKLENTVDDSGVPLIFNSTLDSLPAEFNEAQKKAFGAFVAKNLIGAGGDYKYDIKGRLVGKQIGRGAMGGESTRYEYNDQGDISKEIVTSMPPDGREWSMDDEGNMIVTRDSRPEAAAPTSQFQRAYEYTYDASGNWTRRITRHRTKPGEPWTENQTTTREITYY
jgi:YD repeat-containing protein